MEIVILGFIVLGLMNVIDSSALEGVTEVSSNVNQNSKNEENTTFFTSIDDIKNKIDRLQEENSTMKNKINTLKLDSEIADQYKQLQSSSDAIKDISNALALWVQAIQLDMSNPTIIKNGALINIQEKNKQILDDTIRFKNTVAQGSVELLKKVEGNQTDIADISNIIKYQHEALEYYKRAFEYLNSFIDTNSEYEFQNYVDNATLGRNEAFKAYRLCEKGYIQYYNKVQEV